MYLILFVLQLVCLNIRGRNFRKLKKLIVIITECVCYFFPMTLHAACWSTGVSVCWSVCHNLLKRREVRLPCSYRSNCFLQKINKNIQNNKNTNRPIKYYQPTNPPNKNEHWGLQRSYFTSILPFSGSSLRIYSRTHGYFES